MRGLPRTAHRSGQRQARGAAPELCPPARPPWPWEAFHGARSAAYSPARKRPIDQQSVSAGRGVGAPSHHAGRLPTPAPRPTRACASCPPVRPGPVTAVRQHRNLSGTPSGLRWRLVRGSGPSWCTPRGQVLTQESYGSTFPTLARREESPQRTRGRSGTAADLQERYAICRAPKRRRRGGGYPRHGQSAASPVPSVCAPWGRIGEGKAPPPFERAAEPTGGQNVAWQPSSPRGAAQTGVPW